MKIELSELNIESNNINHHLYGPISDFRGEIFEHEDHLYLSGSGFAADQEGEDHEVIIEDWKLL
jgi:hypothetical protein